VIPFNIPPAPSVPFLQGLLVSGQPCPPISVPWYRFLTSLFNVVSGGQAPLSLGQLIQSYIAQRLALIVPSWLTVSGSPVGGDNGIDGTLTVASASEAQNQVLASPNGSSGALAPRALVGGDLPDPTATTLGGVKSLGVTAHEFLTSISTAGQPVSAQPASTDLSDTITTTPFEPTDQSGAGLAFTNVDVQYSQLYNLVSVYGTLTYPTQADGLSAVISLPILPVREVPGTMIVNSAAGFAVVANTNASAATLTGTSGVLTNADLSGATIIFFLTYPSS
jgi:hypothetical protein